MEVNSIGIGNDIGKKGEKLAKEYLEQNNYKILTTNFYCRQGEIDIIANKEDTVIFVEVKTRSNNAYGKPAEAITEKKKIRMLKAINYYLYKYDVREYVRIDAIEVSFKENKWNINHIKNAIWEDEI